MEQAALADAREQGLVAKLQTATREIEALKRTAKQLSEAEEEDEEQLRIKLQQIQDKLDKKLKKKSQLS